MILEVVDLLIQPGRQAEFDAAVARGVNDVIAKAQGFIRCSIRKGVESPERYLVLIEWRTIEDHTIGFRESPGFTEWRSIVGPFFARAPLVEHFTLLSQTAPN